MTGFRGIKCNGGCFYISHLSNEDHIRVLAKAVSQRAGKTGCINANFSLGDNGLVMFKKKLYRIFYSDNVDVACLVDEFNHRCER